VDFVRDVRPILQTHCYECHCEKKQKSGLRLDLKADALRGGDKHAPDIIAGKPADSPLIRYVTSTDEDEVMPPKGERLSSSEIATLTAWIEQGAVWPDGVDLVTTEDRRDHWAFKPLATFRGAQSIDAFIDAKLAEKGLHRSPPADPISLIRRLSFDLTGLPPSPQDAEAFTRAFAENPETSIEHLVSSLLSSPRYGEHWAQHWLDVVRYADTHGFEVNTERPNAWHYRDYVIRAFNDNTPYDRFIREQIVGDAVGQDAATGFLVTASVLLPGQIGKDEPSKRLARQDSLDEIVMNIGQTFLGLSIGCARCHDHKFDPITASDYYSMQAFVAGVEYGDRELRTPEAAAARMEMKRLQAKLAAVDQQLSRFVPMAKSGVTRPMVSARENRDRFAPVKARRVRFTVRETNSLEPCIDELEVFSTDGQNVALVSLGAKATSSGDIIVADRHDLKHINDGQYGNSRSWMSNEKGKGWVSLEFAEEHEIDRVAWGRDRQGKYIDRLAISYVIEAADDSGEWKVVADSDDRRPFDKRDRTQPAFSTKGLSRDEVAEATQLMKLRAPLESQLRRTEAAQNVFAGNFRTPDDIHLLNRGDPEQPTDPVVPAVLSAFSSLKLPRETPEQERRKTLADWIASPQNPLTARVMVNRIWQGHFGTGLVETPSDFGRSGMKPTHPELLDWLASEFIRSGWSVKHMHQLIVMSETYRQSSAIADFGLQISDSKAVQTHASDNPKPSGARQTAEGSPKGEAGGPNQSEIQNPQSIDSDVRFLWRYPSLRLEAESIRDSILAVSGQLNLKMHGRGFDLFDKRGGLSGFKPVESFTGDGLRRMIYAHKVRRETEAVFGAFDCPDAGQSTSRRRESTTPIQALNLFNSQFTLDASSAFAARVRKDAGADVSAQIRRAYELALSRPPTVEELREVQSVVQKHGLAVLCRALLNSNEFLFVP
jgi:hypothetical protein